MDTTTEYRLTGTCIESASRDVDQVFQSIVKSTSAKQAMNEDRAKLYRTGHEQILYTQVEVKSGDDWEVIPMMQALELE